MAEVIETARNHLPSWVSEYLPANIEEFEDAASKWLRLRYIGGDVGAFVFYVVVGMIIGGMIAFSRDTRAGEPGPLTAALEARAIVLSKAFRGNVFSQVRISALNTILTAIYLAVVLPIAGINLPFLKTMIAITFLVGLLPVIGNLVTNTVIVLVSFSVTTVCRVGVARLPRHHSQARIFCECPHHRHEDKGMGLGASLGHACDGCMVGGCWTYRRANLLRLYQGRTDDTEADLRQRARAAAANGAYGEIRCRRWIFDQSLPRQRSHRLRRISIPASWDFRQDDRDSECCVRRQSRWLPLFGFASKSKDTSDDSTKEGRAAA